MPQDREGRTVRFQIGSCERHIDSGFIRIWGSQAALPIAMADQSPTPFSQLSVKWRDVLSHRCACFEGYKQNTKAFTGMLNNRFGKHFEALDCESALCELKVVVAGDHSNTQVLWASVGDHLLELGVILLGLVKQIAGDDQPFDLQLAALFEDVLKRSESLRMILLCRQVQIGSNGYAQEDP